MCSVIGAEADVESTGHMGNEDCTGVSGSAESAGARTQGDVTGES